MQQIKFSALPVETASEPRVIIFLIMEDLKSNRLLNGLIKIGFDDQYHRSSLGTLILSALGFNEPPIALYRSYYSLLDIYNDQLGSDNENLTKAAFKMYDDLLAEKTKYD